MNSNYIQLDKGNGFFRFLNPYQRTCVGTIDPWLWIFRTKRNHEIPVTYQVPSNGYLLWNKIS